MALENAILCSSHTISGTMPGGVAPPRHGFRERVAACAAAGYAGLCLHFRDYRALRAQGWRDEDLAGILREHGMREAGVEFLVDWFLEGTDAEVALEDERTAYAAARAFGARVINVGSDFRGRGIPRKMLKDRFRALCERAGDRQLSIALEVVPWSDVPDLGTACDMIEGIANAGLVIDSWHMFRANISLADIAALPGGLVFCIQVNDAHREVEGSLAQDTLRRIPCGEGCFDLDGFLNALDTAGATVPLSVEIISPSLANLPADEAACLTVRGARALLDRHIAAAGGR